MPTAQTPTVGSLSLVIGSDDSSAQAAAVSALLDTFVKLIDASREQLGFEIDVEVRVHPFEEGSLEIPFDVILLGSAAVLFEYQNELHQLIQMVKDYLAVKKALRGHSAADALQDDRLVVQGITVTGDNNVINILQNPDVNATVNTAFSRVAADPRIREVRVEDNSTHEEIARIARDEFHYFQDGRSIESPDRPERRRRTTATLTIRSAVLEGGLKWRFNYDGQSISADMKDQSFLDRVAARVERFAAGDRLEVRLEIGESFNSTIGDYERNGKFAVLEVYRHIAQPPPEPPPDPPRLFAV